MKRISNKIKGYSGPNPFSDSQARNFSDKKITNEFYPISNFWSLFNDQHEILLGTRGSGKTVLLKMMRHSMLKKINDPKAIKMTNEKHFIALYVPMHLEFVTNFTRKEINEERQIQLFQFAFNCLLGESLITEIESFLEEIEDKYQRAIKNIKVSKLLNSMWFGDDNEDVEDLFSLSTKIKKLYYSFDSVNGDIDEIASVFTRQICSSLISVKEIVSRELNLDREPTWIVCIDEAEFLSEPLQRCLNNVFRSDSNRITLKVATLPYYHRTLKTLESEISVSSGNDFSYRVVDLRHDDIDFRNLTNALCKHRLVTRFDNSIKIDRLEEFVGFVSGDLSEEPHKTEAQIDYFRKEVGEIKSKRDYIENKIIESFSESRKQTAKLTINKRKPVYDKFAPVYFVREMYDLSTDGNSRPGWYAGSAMIRKISQGNPRLYIQLMNKLFEKARKYELTPKSQHEVLLRYAESFCEATQALESHGPTVYSELKKISEQLKSRVHNGFLIDSGASFALKYDTDFNYSKTKKWLELAVAYSRIIVDEDTLINGMNKNTRYLLSNAYAAKYWLPMRISGAPKIDIDSDQKITYEVKRKGTNQISLFEGEGL